jgi:oligopeptide/dipeptide ABC transporter ATP-binding protein
MRQRVMIAMALATNPEVVIMDEPTTALDVVVQREILAQIVELKKQLDFAVLFITHDLSLLLELADRVAVMYAGRLVEVGRSHDIHHEAAHPYTKGLLNSFPSLRGPRRELAGIPGSPPDLRSLPPGCPFHDRCPWAAERCRSIDMRLAPLDGAADPSHVTACPFVRPGDAAPGSSARLASTPAPAAGPSLPLGGEPAANGATPGAEPAPTIATSWAGMPGAGGPVGSAEPICVPVPGGGVAPEPATRAGIGVPVLGDHAVLAEQASEEADR